MPSIVSWPAGVKGVAGRVSWEMITTHDFHATIIDVLNVKPPAHQAGWGMDGRSIMPPLEAPPLEAPQPSPHVTGQSAAKCACSHAPAARAPAHVVAATIA